MNIQELLHNLGERLATTASVKNVYGEPVSAGNRTVIPMASVRFGFGGGGGEAKGANERAGGGGGGGLVATPCGALEITPEGTRFLTFPNYRVLGCAVAAGFFIGALVARRGKSGKRAEAD